MKSPEIVVTVVQVAIGGFLVWHGWSGEPANIYPFLFGLWVLLDARLHVNARLHS